MIKKPGELVSHVDTGSFEQLAYAAHLEISQSVNTRKAYWDDAKQWSKFCVAHGIDPFKARSLHVTAWIEDMRQRGCAPKTRARRIASLASIYRYLRRLTDEDGEPAPAVKMNPFSTDDGPKREVAHAKRPTPMASSDAIKKVLDTCKAGKPLDLRDAALIRILWSTGARRESVVEMTFDRLENRRNEYIAKLIGKGGKEVPVLIRGRAAEALTAWLHFMDAQGAPAKGPIFRTRKGKMTPKGLWEMLRDRAKLAKVGKLSPHMFRVAFLTLNPASLEAKQSAAGHANPATTMLYDRASWRGRQAFEKMPELEEVEDE